MTTDFPPPGSRVAIHLSGHPHDVLREQAEVHLTRYDWHLAGTSTDTTDLLRLVSDGVDLVLLLDHDDVVGVLIALEALRQLRESTGIRPVILTAADFDAPCAA
ncbi:hypothetical protein GCM10022243_23650 [Saccharothrix violaceirubra]|uniref:Response regulatory domain-containing protein n=1 Tax=Saccharothrix violaceirubra TaxID=413306 RepID=A0A7W7T792_9PSEU|nr:hypothetical protein [Saccharothrix violaceirubra]MBB4967810.1 hypothetical protein [Saccharothrix violaceirubra]